MPESAPSTHDPPAHVVATPLRRALRNAVALLVIYGNVAVALQPPVLRRMGARIPRPAFIADAFLITGMFRSYSLLNSDFFILGRRTLSGEYADRGQWIQLRVREHFPQRHGVVFTELFAAHHWDIHGVPAQRRAWAFLARKLREHHNRLHPQHAIDRVRFGSVQWPQNPRGYRAGKAPGQTRMRTWFSESERP